MFVLWVLLMIFWLQTIIRKPFIAIHTWSLHLQLIWTWKQIPDILHCIYLIFIFLFFPIRLFHLLQKCFIIRPLFTGSPHQINTDVAHRHTHQQTLTNPCNVLLIQNYFINRRPRTRHSCSYSGLPTAENQVQQNNMSSFKPALLISFLTYQDWDLKTLCALIRIIS